MNRVNPGNFVADKLKRVQIEELRSEELYEEYYRIPKPGFFNGKKISKEKDRILKLIDTARDDAKFYQEQASKAKARRTS